MYLEAVEQAVSIEKMNNTSFNPSTCTIKEDGILNCEGTNVQVEVKGEKPLKGNIVFQSGKITEVRLEYKNKKIVLKNEKGNLEYFDYNRNSDINFVVEEIKEQKTTTGKNLYSGGDVEATNGGKVVSVETIPAGTYVISANVTSTDTDSDYCLILLQPNAQGVYLKRGTRVSATFTTKFDITGMSFYTSNNNANSSGDTATFTDIQIEAGEEATEYEEYTGGKPSPSLEYPQEIPLAGTLNTKTGKYDIGVTASIEGGKSQTLTLTSPVKLTKWDKLVKRDGVWGWSVWSFEEIHDENNLGTSTVSVQKNTNGDTYFILEDLKAKYSYPLAERVDLVSGTSLSDSFIENNPYSTSENCMWRRIDQLRIRIDDESVTDKNTLNTWIAEHPFKVVYQTQEEVAFYPLPDEEQTLLYKLKL